MKTYIHLREIALELLAQVSQATSSRARLEGAESTGAVSIEGGISGASRRR